MEKTDILIVGAGQAGLAAAYHLRTIGLSYLLVDGAARIGDSWRRRYDSLQLFTPRSLSALPGLRLLGDPKGYAGRDEFASYLETYAAHFDLPVALNTPLKRLEQHNGHFTAASTNGLEIEARVVIVASGGFQKPIVPAVAKGLSNAVQQFTPADYRIPAQVPGGTVVVVGDGATGRDIAWELAESHTVYLATGKPRRLMPEKILGISAWWWLNSLGLLTAPSSSFVGRKIRQTDAFPDRNRSLAALRRRGIQIMPRLAHTDGEVVLFQNNTAVSVNAVIWAAGYRDDSDWVAVPQAIDAHGTFIHHQGISPVQNLYFVGRPFQTSRASALICGVARDAEAIGNEIKRLKPGC